jgi:flagellar biosynthesis protein FlhF
MHIKRFEAETMEAALAQVRETLGPDALILSSRTIQRGRSAFGLLARRGVEVQAALPRAGERTEAGAPGVARPRIETGAGEIDSEAALRGLVDELRREMAVLRRREPFEEEVRSELRGLRSAVGQLVDSRPGAEFDRAVCSLAQAGLDWIHAQSLVEEWQGRSAEGVVVPLERVLQERIEARLAPPRPDPASPIRIVVGAPGAGKTTSLAKLAGRAEEGEREIAFVSLDPFRIGAREQLRAFAGLLDSPYSELSSPDGLAEIARRHPGHAIFVDTAGRSPGDTTRLAPLEGLRHTLGRETAIELVIDATSRRDVARAQLSRFAPLAPDRLILTRLDECDSLAPVVNLLLEDRCPPLCWLGTGQRVPEDLEIAEPALFARDVMGRAA